MANSVVETYSRLATEYERESNSQSCWAQASQRAIDSVAMRESYRVVVDVGCGTGKALAQLAALAHPAVSLIGVEPAADMRTIARRNTGRFPQVTILDGSFEHIPLPSNSVDYLLSILAFHWTTDVHQSASEIARVLRPAADVDLFFIGRDNGQEFIRKTSPIFLKYMGPARFIESARMRKQLTRQEAYSLFARHFEATRLAVEECHDTYYDTLESHLGWWVRIEGQFVDIPPEKRERCDREVRNAIATLEEKSGIPYTIHQLHVKLRAT